MCVREEVEFQTVGAAKEKERLLLADRIFNTLRRCLLAAQRGYE